MWGWFELDGSNLRAALMTAYRYSQHGQAPRSWNDLSLTGPLNL